MFAAGSGPRACLIDQAPALGQRPLRGASIDPVAYASRRERLPVGFLPVRLIAKNPPLLPMQQRRQLSDVGGARIGREYGVDDATLVRPDGSYADIGIRPIMPSSELCRVSHDDNW